MSGDDRTAGRPVIPDASLTKPPSAELRPGQLDADSLPDYEVLDAIPRTSTGKFWKLKLRERFPR